VFGTKAETLERLAPLVQKSRVLPLAWFQASEWRRDRKSVLQRLRSSLPSTPWIVRSSALGEDGAGASMAGAYLSVPNVDSRDDAAVRRSVDSVLASYRREADDDQVLVQEQLGAVRLAGVLACRDTATLSPYRVFNYDDRTASTRSVTGGTGDHLRTYVRFRGARQPYPCPDLEAVYRAAEEVEQLVGTDRIEMELAVDGTGRVCLFQVRPITTAGSPPPDATVEDFLVKVCKKVEKLSAPHPYLYGRRSVFGVMPDWNPAEIVGLRPRALALSLYKELITDSIWAYQRDNYGYKNLRSFPLLVSFLGVPFIDVRVCFNSFVPKGLREPLSEKLVDYYVGELVRRPSLHDKVEFEIVFSCYTPTIREDIRRLETAGFEGAEIGEILAELRALTNRILHPSTGLYIGDLEKVEALRPRRERILASDLSTVSKIYWLVEDCKRYGTLPFSGLARAGFIAMQMLSSLVELDVLSGAERDAFLQSLDTVTHRLVRDFDRLRKGEMGMPAFLSEYGHLRPGTYDILSPRYDEAVDRYFRSLGPAGTSPGRATFTLTGGQRKRLTDVLNAEGIETTPDGFFSFLRSAIEGREYAKLVFTRSLSDALRLIRELGERVGLDVETMSHVNFRTILNLYATLDGLDLREVLRRDAESNRESFEVTRAVRLPSLVLQPDDVFHFHLLVCEPNFIGSGRAVGEVVREEEFGAVPLDGRVVFIPSADPGYDWIFLKRIAGLVTMFGGANSHMAIRAAEQGVPAIIGCGEVNYREWSQAQCLEVDCAGRRVVVLR